MTKKASPDNTHRLTSIILAAGKGTRMKTSLPKVLHPVAGVPMISRAISAVKKAGANEVRVVVGYGEALVKHVVEPMEGICFKQQEQLGTAHAVLAAEPDSIEGTVLILNGDHPLIEAKDIKKIHEEFLASSYDLCVVSCELKKPQAFGRIVRHNGEIKAIVEVKDASHDTLKINEVNVGIYMAKADILAEHLPQIKNNNAQSEYYLTDIVTQLLESGLRVGVIKTSAKASFGVNSQVELAKATQLIFKRKARRLMEEGVMLIDPNSTYVEEAVKVGAATVIYPGTYLRGNCDIGPYCVIEPNCFLYNSQLAEGVIVRAMTHLEDAVVGSKTELGPYARLRPGTNIEEECKIGNFVELKKVNFGKGSKAGHLAYIGDADIGNDVNIGCGAVFVNYAVDRKKYKSTVGDNAFIGSDSQLVAPVHVGKNAIVASGSTVTKDVPDGALAVARGRQKNIENYKVKSPAEKQKDK